MAEIKDASALEPYILNWMNFGRDLQRAAREVSRGRTVSLPELPASPMSSGQTGQTNIDIDQLAEEVAKRLHKGENQPPSPDWHMNVFERVPTSTSELAEEVYQLLKDRLPAASSSNGSPVNEEQIAESIFARVETQTLSSQKLREALKKVADELDLEAFTEQVWEEIDVDTLHEKLAEKLAERALKLIDLKELLNRLVELIEQDNNNSYIDFDSLYNDLADEIKERVQISLLKKEQT